MSPSRIAYLIIAHHQPGHLNRLIQRLQHSNDHFFIYIDQRQDLQKFQAAVINQENCHWILRRKSIHWVGIGTVQAELELLKEAYQFGAFSQYVLLSGSDYPIKPLPYIRSFLLNEKRIFIPVHGCIYPTADERFRNRYDRYHFLNNDYLNPRGLRSNRFPFHHIRTYLTKHPISRSIPTQTRLYQGPTWVGLTQAFVDYLFREVDTRRLVNFYRHMYCPDEMFLPSLVKNSPFEKDLYFDFEQNTEGLNWLGLFYTDWHTPHVVLPKTLDASDLDALQNSHPHALFARKFDEEKSAELLTLIDETILLRSLY